MDLTHLLYVSTFFAVKPQEKAIRQESVCYPRLL